MRPDTGAARYNQLSRAISNLTNVAIGTIRCQFPRRFPRRGTASCSIRVAKRRRNGELRRIIAPIAPLVRFVVCHVARERLLMITMIIISVRTSRRGPEGTRTVTVIPGHGQGHARQLQLSGALKAEVRRSFITTTVREHNPRSTTRAPISSRADSEVCRSFITTTVREEPQVTPQGRHR